MDDWDDLLLNAKAYLLVGGAGLVLAAIALWFAPYVLRRPLPLPRLRPGRWTGREVTFALIGIHVVPLLVAFIIYAALAMRYVSDHPDAKDLSEIEIHPIRLMIFGSPLTLALTLALLITVLFGISRTRPHQIGVTWARWPANVVAGVLLFLLMTPVTLGAFSVTSLVLGADEHPFERLMREGFAPWEWGLLVFMTVVGAPILEEIVFRGVLQGWLRRASWVGQTAIAVTVLCVGSLPLLSYLAPGLLERQVSDPMKAVLPALFGALLAAIFGCWAFALRMRLRAEHLSQWLPERDPVLAGSVTSPVADNPAAILPGLPAQESANPIVADDADCDPDVRPIALREPPAWRDPVLEPHLRDWARANARLSVFGSAMLFAMFHDWPQPIPLFLLGVALGWLAYRTQSLIGGIVCHALFNAVACLVLFWGGSQ